MLAGKNASAQIIGALCGFCEEKELRQAGTDLMMKSRADLVNLLPQS
jgi:phosphoglycolate phosphatase-like HAD superfamily hydrolase